MHKPQMESLTASDRQASDRLVSYLRLQRWPLRQSRRRPRKGPSAAVNGGLRSVTDSGSSGGTELDAALMQAAVDGDLKLVQALTNQGANRHVQHSHAMLPYSYDRDAFDTPLEAAAWMGHTLIVRHFLKDYRKVSLSPRLLLKRKRRKQVALAELNTTPQVLLDREAFLVACQGGNLSTVQCFVETFGDGIVTQPTYHTSQQHVSPLHHACARCDVTLLEYLIQHGARLDGPPTRGATPIHWLGLYVEMKELHSGEEGGMCSPIPLPDDLSVEAYEQAMAYVIRHHRSSLFVPDGRGFTALQRLLRRAPLSVMQTTVTELVAGMQDNDVVASKSL